MTQSSSGYGSTKPSASNVPSFVHVWFGSFRGLQLVKLEKGVYLFACEPTGRGLVVRADNAPAARAAARRFVSEVDPRTDRRRTWWVYT